VLRNRKQTRWYIPRFWYGRWRRQWGAAGLRADFRGSGMRANRMSLPRRPEKRAAYDIGRSKEMLGGKCGQQRPGLPRMTCGVDSNLDKPDDSWTDRLRRWHPVQVTGWFPRSHLIGPYTEGGTVPFPREGPPGGGSNLFHPPVRVTRGKRDEALASRVWA
jgi:hypothetical protein